MGITLITANDGLAFDANFWHWRALVEAVRRLNVLPDDRVEGLHDPFCGNGLTREEARLVADALESRVLPTLSDGERLLLDGTTTSAEDDGTFYKGADAHQNYSTNRNVMTKFIDFLRECPGFEVC